MLWLAGIMGLVGVGAASIAVVNLEQEPEEDEPDLELDMSDTGNLLDELDITDDYFEELDATVDTTEPLADGLSTTDTDDLLTASYDDILFNDEMDANSGDSTLHDIVRDPFGGGFIDLDSNGLDAAEPTDTSEVDDTGISADPVMLGDWITEGEPSEVLDYENEKDSLMLVWDDLVDGAQEPDVDVAHDPYDNEVMHVLMNGKSVAEVYGDPELTVSDVTIIPLSSALIVGLEPA